MQMLGGESELIQLYPSVTPPGLDVYADYKPDVGVYGRRGGAGGGGHGATPQHEAARRRPGRGGEYGAKQDMSSLFKERHDSFSPSEMVALYCRHLHEAVEVFDWKIRMKRLTELSRELSHTVSYKVLYQRRQDIWNALKELGDPLIDAELTDSDGRHYREEPIYREAMARVRRMRSVELERDYYYESMLMDVQALETALVKQHAELAYQQALALILRAMVDSKNAPELEIVLRVGSQGPGGHLVKDSLEAAAAARLAVVYRHLEDAVMMREAVEIKNEKLSKEKIELVSKCAELQEDVNNKADEIADLKRKLAESKRANKTAVERAQRAETKVEEERQVIAQVKEALHNMEGQNTALVKEIEFLKEQLDRAAEYRDQIVRLEADVFTARADAENAERVRAAREADAIAERDMRRKTDKHVMDLRKEMTLMKEQVQERDDKLKELQLSKEGLIKDLEHERVWRQEWNAVHDQVRDAVGRLYTADPPAVIDERSHKVMAMLQERIASETYVRSQLADLEDKLHREAGQKLLLERRIAALQAQMLDMRVRAARGDMPLEGRADWGGGGAGVVASQWGEGAGGAGGGGKRQGSRGGTPRRKHVFDARTHLFQGLPGSHTTRKRGGLAGARARAHTQRQTRAQVLTVALPPQPAPFQSVAARSRREGTRASARPLLVLTPARKRSACWRY